MIAQILKLNFKQEAKKLALNCRDKNISAFGLPFYPRAIVAAHIHKTNGGRTVMVFADYVVAKKAYLEISAILSDVLYLPARGDTLVYNKRQTGDSDRLKVLSEILIKDEFFLITTVEALTNLYPLKEKLASSVKTLVKGHEYDLNELAKFLSSAGYERAPQAESPGQFAVRGDILDVFPLSGEPIRAEFFGDTLDELREYVPATQLSKDARDSITLYPCTDIFYTAADVDEISKTLKKELKPGEKRESIASDIILRLSGGDKNLSLGYVLPLLPHTDFGEFVCPTQVIYDDAKSVSDTFNVLEAELNNRFKTIFERGEAFSFLLKSFNVNALIIDSMQIAFHRLTTANRIFNPDMVLNFSALEIPSYTKRLFDLIKDVENWVSTGNRVIIFCRDLVGREKIGEMLTENRIGFYLSQGNLYEREEREVVLLDAPLPFGGAFFDEKLVLIGSENIFYQSKKVTLKRGKSGVFSEVAVGDYAVHHLHGIGFVEKIERLEMGGAARDYYLLNYEGGDKLYVPIENSDSLSRYVGEKPKLSRVGGAEFTRQKDKARASAKKMAFDLMQLYAERADLRGHAYSSDDTFLNEFSLTFPYNETDDQLDAIAEGLNDLKSGKIMDRLLCGDVGYGKTEVALRLAFKVIAEGKQVAFIAPTTILAKQHYNTVKSRMDGFGVNAVSLTRFDDAKAIEKNLLNIEVGKADIVCGTHRVLSKDVVFKDLGLLILDEEQRFGVNDKEKIKNLKKNVNVLSLSATPIPRTLNMSLIGVRDISILETPPASRIAVQTFVTEYSEGLVLDAITREINRGGQAFIVFNRVAEIESFAFKIRNLLGDIKISIAHGQMEKSRLEPVIEGFVNGESDVLIASTIIENGIDIAKANTMIVVDADRMGLSQLYQLKGRVGRSDRLAYVFFTFDDKKQLTEAAYKRLEAIGEHTELGSGFKIAMKDLEIRGAGTIMGAEQSGHMEKIGYDLYCKILEGAVKELKGEGASNEEREVKVLTDFSAFIPDEYIPSPDWKLKLYASIARLSSFSELERMKNELSDVYGTIPDPALNLLTIAVLKNLAAKIGAASVTVKKTGCNIKIDKLNMLKKEVVASIKDFEGELNIAKSIIDFKSGNRARINMIKFLANLHKIKA